MKERSTRRVPLGSIAGARSDSWRFAFHSRYRTTASAKTSTSTACSPSAIFKRSIEFQTLVLGGRRPGKRYLRGSQVDFVRRRYARSCVRRRPLNPASAIKPLLLCGELRFQMTSYQEQSGNRSGWLGGSVAHVGANLNARSSCRP
jgi:hypothetical protein